MKKTSQPELVLSGVDGLEEGDGCIFCTLGLVEARWHTATRAILETGLNTSLI